MTTRHTAPQSTAKNREARTSRRLAKLASALSLGLCAMAGHAANPDSFSFGIMSTGPGMPGGAKCVSSSGPLGLTADGILCDGGGGGGVGFVGYNSTGGWGSYAVTSNPSLLRFGSGGADRMQITGTSINSFLRMDMGANKITNMAGGTIASGSLEAVNGGQIQAISSSLATVFGGSASVNPDGTLTAPSYALTRANAIAGLSGAATTVAAGFDKVDAALNQLSLSALVKQDASSKNITVAQATDGTLVDFAGTAGSRKLTGVAVGAVGAASLDAINGSQLFGVSSSVATHLGGGSVVNADGTVSAPAYSIGGQTFNNVGGALTNLDGRVNQNTTDITNITNNLNNGIVGLVKQDATSRDINVATDKDGTRVNFAGTAGDRVLAGVANGAVTATSKEAVNGSQLHGVSSSVATHLGGGSVVNADGTISAPTYNIDGQVFNNVGGALTNLDGRTTQNTTNITNLTNLTNDLKNGSIGLVKQDATSRDITVARDTDGTRVSVAGTAGDRVVTGVKAGTVTATSVDAVNGSQLHGVASSTSNAFGGGSVVNVDGTVSAPSYSVGGQTVNNVGAAVSNLDKRVNDLNNGTAGLVQQDAATKEVTVAKATGGKVVNVAGSEGPRRLTGVERGVGNSDAVNMGQFNEAINRLDSRIDDTWNNLSRDLEAYNRQSNRGIAAASALINVTPYVPGRVAMNAGIATYRGETALGVGLSRWSEDGKLNVNGGISAAHGDKPVVRVGVGIVF